MGVCINRYVGQHEKTQPMEEDSEQDKKSTECIIKKPQSTAHQISMTDNVLLSNSSESSSSPSNYDKLCLSLLSGLPNEQELALNVCTILSNEGSYMLQLEQAPKLVDLLVAQTGVWRLDDDSLKKVYLETWQDMKGRNMCQFWKSTLDLKNEKIAQIFGEDIANCQEYEDFFNLDCDLGSVNVEGQRVLRIALILHNLSFEKNNVPVLVASKTFLRFLLLSMNSSWANLKQTAYDTLSNIAYTVKLSFEKDVCSRLLFQYVKDGIQSFDRYLAIRSMDILSQLCSSDLNEDVIPSLLDIEVYQQMVSYLTAHDIMLLFNTLEALYALSDLGRYPCDRIACVHGSIASLVSLLTLDPSQYGPSAQIRMKIVETLVPAESTGEEEENKTDSTTTELTAATPVSTSSTNIVTVDSETFASNWLKSTYEASAGNIVPRNDVYADYVSFCSKAGRKGVLNANIFSTCVKNTFPQCGMKKVTSNGGVVTFHHDGLKRKNVVMSLGIPPVSKAGINTSTSKVSVTTSTATTTVTTKSVSKPVQSPILKAQLSATASATPLLKSYSQAVAKASATTPTRAPNPSTSSTLIKSLLANKVQQRNTQQNVPKMLIYSPGKVTTLPSGIVGSPTTIVRCIRPSALPQGNVTHQVRPGLQARIIPNKACLITTPNAGVIKANPMWTPKTQSHVCKATIVTSSASPVNITPTSIQVSPTSVQLNPVQVSSPMQMARTSMQVSQSPIQITRTPMQVSQPSIQITRSPIQVSQSPIQIARAPIQVSQSTMQIAHTPMQLSQSPLQVTQTHIQASQPQVQLAHTPVQVSSPSLSLTHAPLQVSPSSIPISPTSVQLVHTPMQVSSPSMQFVHTPTSAQVSNSPVQVTSTPLQVVPTQLQLTPTSMQIATKPIQVGTSSQLQLSPSSMQITPAQIQVAATPMQITSKHIHIPANPGQVASTPMQITSPTMQINGIQNDMLSNEEDLKNAGCTSNYQIKQTNSVLLEKHLSYDSGFDTKDSVFCDEIALSAKDIITPNQNILLTSVQDHTVTYKLANSNELSSSSGNFYIVRSQPSGTVISPVKEQNAQCELSLVNGNSLNSKISVPTQSIVQPKIISPTSSILNSVLTEFDSQPIGLSRVQQLQRESICKKAPLLNGLLDKCKLPLLEEFQSKILLQNGSNSKQGGDSDRNKLSTIQLNVNQSKLPLSSSSCVVSMPIKSMTPDVFSSLSNSIYSSNSINQGIFTVANANPVASLSLNSIAPGVISSAVSSSNTITPISLNSIVIPSSSLNSVIIPASSISSTSVQPSLNSTITTNVSHLSTAISSAPVLVPSVLPATSFHSNGTDLMQICTGQTTFSGTVEVQPDQKGVVRLHIESPENSNQGSDLSSISDIARTLECASQAISKTNAECNTQQVPYSSAGVAPQTVTVINANAPTLARAGQQIIVVTPVLNQPQLQLQSPNIKLCILQSFPKTEDSVDLITIPQLNINQLRHSAPEPPILSTTTLKRPSSETLCIATNAKKPRIESNSPLLEASLRIPTAVASTSVETKLRESLPIFIKSDNAISPPKPALSSPIQKMDIAGEKEVKSFSGLLSTNDKGKVLSGLPTLTEKGKILSGLPTFFDKTKTLSNLSTINEKGLTVSGLQAVSDKGKTFSGLTSANDKEKVLSGLTTTSDNSSRVTTPTAPKLTKLEFFCEWKNCCLKFPNPGSVFLHASKVHVPVCNEDVICQWEGCDSMKRKRFSLLTHLQDWHCNERVLHTQAMRKLQLSQQGKTSIQPPPKPPPHPGYAPDAAVLAIKRHALQYINPKELSEEKESALTKSIRLTSALILRNLVTHSSVARTYVRRFEPELAYLAMSPVESARTIAQCLSELSRTHD